jgi:hypothetical protein
VVAFALLVGLASAGCSSSGPGSNNSALCGAPGGAVAGAEDSHCGSDVQPVAAASCQGGMSMDMDGGMMDMDGGVAEQLPDPRFTSAGDDDDCKYHVAWTATPICQGSDVTFTVTVTTKGDGQPAEGANPAAEALLSDTHPAPNSNQQTTETGPGVFEIGPVRFDASGRWTVRFHLHEDCVDMLPDSPHGHVAFYVDVP